MRLVQTEGIEIDVDNSIKYGGIYITRGTFTGLNVAGNFEPVVTDFICNSEGRHYVQVYVNALTGGVRIDEAPVELCEFTGVFHIGGVVALCDAGGHYTIEAELLPENPCISYARPFSSAFGTSMNKKQAQYDLCSIIAGVNEFQSDWNCDFAIQGTTLPCPEEFALFNGNSGLYNGNIELINGNLPNPNPIN